MRECADGCTFHAVGISTQESPRSGANRSSKASPKSPCMVNAVNDILPTVMVINNEIIVEDDDEVLSRQGRKSKRARAPTKPETRSESSSDSSEDTSDSRDESASGDDAGFDGSSHGSGHRTPRRVVREIAAKEREDTRKSTNATNRAASPRNLWLTRFQEAFSSVKSEPTMATGTALWLRLLILSSLFLLNWLPCCIL